jgi:diacylglycerol kinase (ATP)
MPEPSAPRSLRIISNPNAGGGRDSGQGLRAAAGRFAEQGWTVSWCFTERPGHARELAAAAAAEGLGVVAAAGGDGTINEVVNGLVGSPTALAVLPAGTGNVLAAQLGLVGVPTPLHRADLVAAAEALCAGVVRPVDTGLAQSAGGPERHFVLWAGVGLDAEVAREIETTGRLLKRRFGPAAYGALAARAALVATGTPAVVTCDGERIDGRLLLGVVANVRLYGGTVDLSPEALLDDGRLDVSLFMGASVLAKLRHLGAVLARRRAPRSEWRGLSAARIAITADPPLPVHLDAEPFGTTPVVLTVRPRSLRLLVPPTAPPGLFVQDLPGDAEPRR